MELVIGDRIVHPRYGEGIISRVLVTTYEIFFEKGGKMELMKNDEDLQVKEENPEADRGPKFSIKELEQSIVQILDKYNGLFPEVLLGDKWTGGKIIIQPGNKELQSKEIPIDTFFHKIVMVRDRLRVLEQNINSNKSLTDEEKVHIQQYITRAYGSLTTFNVLFTDKEDYFKGSKSSD